MYSRTRIKICGITNPRDALEAARLGVDALGFVFYGESARLTSVEQARHATADLPPFLDRVALFLDAQAPAVQAVVDGLQPDLLQFHGNESPEFCDSFGVPYIKAVAMGTSGHGGDDLFRYPNARGLLLDSHSLGQAGGSGESFDWSRIPDNLDKPLILAGGLRAQNIVAAIRSVRPYAVDVSSGVESKPGIKDHALMQDFIREVTRGDHS